MGNPRSQLKAHAAALLDRADWQRVHEGLEVKLVVGHTEQEERFIVCRSTDRAAKEAAMLQRQLDRLRVALHKLDKHLRAHALFGGAVRLLALLQGC